VKTARLRKTLSATCQRQLNSYALAATAAGVGVLAPSQPAEGKVVYTPVHRVVRGGDPGITYLDLNHDGIADFKFQNWAVYSSDVQLATLSILPSGTNGIRGYGGSGIFSFRWASALPAGTRIGQKDKFFTEKSDDMMLRGPFSWGQWMNVKNRYLGFRFSIKGKTHYGWARLNVEYNPKTIVLKALLTGYAYETVPNKPIITGKIKGPDVVTVQPGSLGHLAAGASETPMWRAKETQ
jgi:hypothetical protein